MLQIYTCECSTVTSAGMPWASPLFEVHYRTENAAQDAAATERW